MSRIDTLTGRFYWRKDKEVSEFHRTRCSVLFYCLMAHKSPGIFNINRCLGPLTADSPGELDILGHDSHPLGVDSREISIFEKTNEVSFCSLLEGKNLT